jgi:hypothetical protein
MQFFHFNSGTAGTPFFRLQVTCVISPMPLWEKAQLGRHLALWSSVTLPVAATNPL